MAKTLTDLFNKGYVDLPYPDLLSKCEEMYNTYSISPEQAKKIEEKQGINLNQNYGFSSDLAE